MSAGESAKSREGGLASPELSAKPSSSSLSASLTAHLTKAVAPAVSPASNAEVHSSAQQPIVRSFSPRLPLQIQHNGKAPATAADSDAIANSELWRSGAARRAEKAWAIQSEKTLQNDAKFRKYAVSVEKTLASFESVSEWADFIAFLGRLLKTLQTGAQYNAIPRKLIVAKRLSQCLNPALPSGVHQRALEVYEHIFSVIGAEGLRRDLSVWSPGLLPFFQFASTNVKPIVLGLIEHHYLPLRQDLRSIAKPLQLALLPGLEEEASEHFERVLKLLDRIEGSIGQAYFMQNLWLILISMPTVRLPVLHYVAKRLPDLNKLQGSDVKKISDIVGPDLGLLVRAFAAALEDQNLLVLRAMLDIMISCFKISSTAFKDLVRAEDKISLVLSALGIVLRKDISLNRRLYTWLLGPSDEVKSQQAYFDEHAIHWARLALLAEFRANSKAGDARTLSATERQRPYRILISLLDKWSIGLPMTNALILDTFKSLRKLLQPDEEDQADDVVVSNSSDVSTTAKMLFESVDPFAMYRQFFKAVCHELQSDNEDPDADDTIALLRFIFAAFRVHDEESRVVHLPTLFSSVVELVSLHPESSKAVQALYLAHDILNLIPKRIFTGRAKTMSHKKTSFPQHGQHLYEANSSGVDEAAKRYIGFQHPDTVAELVDLCASLLFKNPMLTAASLTLFCQLLNLLDVTMDSETETELIRWDADAWMERIKASFRHLQSFIDLEACFEATVAASSCRALASPVNLDQSGAAPMLFARILHFLTPSASPYHVRSVELIWTLADLSTTTILSSQITSKMNSSSDEERASAYSIFGVMWKFSEDSRLSHDLLAKPFFCIMNGLRSNVWTEQEMAEKWVRSHARNFTALLDPLLVMLKANEGGRREETYVIEGIQFEAFVYKRRPDHEKIIFALSAIREIARVGSSAFVRSVRGAQLRKSSDKRLQVYVTEANPQESYMDFLIACLLLLLKSDAETNDIYLTAHQTIHAIALEIVALLLPKVQLEEIRLGELEQSVLQRLLIEISHGRTQIQDRCLQALHSVINGRHNSAQPIRNAVPPPAFLLPTIKAGLSSPTNRAVLQQWTDFILAIAPHYRSALGPLLLPLNQGLCALIRADITALERAYEFTDGDAACSTTDMDVVLLMAMSEKILLQSLEVHLQSATTPTSAQGSSEKGGETFSFMGALSNVFSTEPTGTDSSGATASNAVWKSLHQTVMTLHLAWLLTKSDRIAEDSRQDSLDVVRRAIQVRTRRYLERLYRSHSGEVVEALIACWNLSAQQDNQVGCLAAFEVLALLAPSSQIVMTFLCDVIATRSSDPSTAAEKLSTSNANSGNASKQQGSAKHMNTPGVPDTVLLAFMEAFLLRLDANATTQVWPVVAIFVKEIINNSALHKSQIYPTLRCLTVIVEHLVEEKSVSEDKKLRRELVDSYVRLIDLNILIAGRSFEQTTWIGRRTVAIDADVDAATALPKSATDEKMSASVADLTPGQGTSLVEAAQLFLADRVFPSLRASSFDSDKILTLTTNVVYYVIQPALKSKRKSADISPPIVILLLAVTSLPGTLKAWRAAVSEFFFDNRFFELDPLSGERWKPIIFSLMQNDKERFVETIGRISTPSTNIFTNREAETKVRIMNLRRMAYVIFASPTDHWLTQLPLVQEKLVDLLRNSTVDPAISEVYLCLRVLLTRFESRHLSGFWPVVITEMMRLLESCLEELPADDSDALLLLDSACRFLDLLVTLQTDEFQIHQWLFITDTIDVVYPPDDWAPESILDRLASAIEEKRGVDGRQKRLEKKDVARSSSRSSRTPPTTKDLGGGGGGGTTKRRPFLLGHSVHPATRIETLQPFFANISLHAFESTYASGANVDAAVIEDLLNAALFTSDEDNF